MAQGDLVRMNKGKKKPTSSYISDNQSMLSGSVDGSNVKVPRGISRYKTKK